MKRVAIKRSTPEKIRAWAQRSRKRLRPRSVKQAAAYVERRAFVAEYLAAHPFCEAHLQGCTLRSVDVHEIVRRSHGGAIFPGQKGKRETEYLAVCRPDHDWISTHPKLAKEHGLEVR